MNNYTKQQPTHYMRPPSDYFGKTVRVIRGRHTGKTGTVILHNTGNNVIGVANDDEEFFTNAACVEIVEAVQA